MATTTLSYEDILKQAHDSWPGATGIQRAQDVKAVIDSRLENYSTVTGFSKEEILLAFEKKRDVNTVNFYQSSRLPLLNDVHVFKTLKDFRKEYPSGNAECPSCSKIIPDYYDCPECGWKVYGLFGDMGKGIKVLILDVFLENPLPMVIFKPTEFPF